MGLLNDLLYPPRCAFCGKLVSKGNDFCPSCEKEVPRIPADACRICGVEKKLCVCRKRSFPCQRRIAPFYYEGEAKHGILRFKKYGHFGGYRTMARLVAEKAAEEYADVPFDAVVCVPPSKRMKKERGYSQTVLLAKEIARQLELPFEKKQLVQLYESAPQKGMSRVNRIGNVAGVYDVRDPDTVKGKNYLLIDDVITTGATVNECAKMLRIFGANRVYAAAVCAGKPFSREEQEEKKNSQ